LKDKHFTIVLEEAVEEAVVDLVHEETTIVIKEEGNKM
jgi:hypothetical protein